MISKLLLQWSYSNISLCVAVLHERRVLRERRESKLVNAKNDVKFVNYCIGKEEKVCI